MVTLAGRQHAADYLQARYEVSERRACKVVSIHRNTKRAYEHKTFTCELEQIVIDLSGKKPRWGYRKVYDRMKLDGRRIGRERVRLIRAREGACRSEKSSTRSVIRDRRDNC